jgi:hypothetical protein
MRLARLWLVPAAGALALLLRLPPAYAQDQMTAHRLAAAQYEVHGLVEEAVAEYIKLLALAPGDVDARARVEALVRKQMPMWLPEEAEGAAPFKCEALTWGAPARGTTGAGGKPPRAPWRLPPYGDGPAQRFLVTAVDFAAREGERWDELHEAGFSHIDYGYAWSESKRRYEARVVVHWEEPAQGELAGKALRATLVFYCLAREQLGFDPTRPWGDPVDIWITNKGKPGARAQGSSIYLYAAKTERRPGEWLRELAHEYGHVSFPGIGGFTETSDPWADGELAELLFPKWLMGFGAEASRLTDGGQAEATKATKAAGGPEWMPWAPAEWEAEAKGERERLMGLWAEEGVRKLIGQETRGYAAMSGRHPGPPVADLGTPALQGNDQITREAFLGLALRVEEMKGARYLGEVLKKCPRGTATQFVRALGRQR